jgi:predicted metalloprotease with PDZ domain
MKSLGLSLVKSNNGILISRIDRESDLAASGLKAGMTLLTVNGSLCPNTVPDTVLMIKSTSGDVEVTAVFRGAKLSISPAAPHRGVAEPFIRPTQQVIDVKEGNVTSPEPTGFANFFRRLFCGLGSSEKMEDNEAILETEKRETEEKSLSETTESASESSPEPEKPLRTFTFRVQRLSWQDPIGVKLKRGKGGIVVAEIMKNSPFRFTGLRPGMRIHEINGIGCPGSLIVAENLLKGIENDVELVVTSEEKKPDFRPVPVLFYSDI